jgi:hypothetical protein
MTTNRTQPTQEPFLSNARYDILKDFVTVVLPAIATFYMIVAPLWGLPKPDAVSTTITAMCTVLGLVLRVLSRKYASTQAENSQNGSESSVPQPKTLPVEYDGVLSIATIGENPTDLVLHVNSEDVEHFRDKDQVIFKVNVA